MQKLRKSNVLLSASLTAALSLSDCGLQPSALTTTRASVNGAQIDTVLERVKQEVGLFLMDSTVVNQKWPQLLTDLGGIKPVCGTGKIDFNITSHYCPVDR